MNDRLRENYFVFVRLALMVVLCGYGTMSETDMSGVSVGILLLVSFYIGVMAAKELFRGPMKLVMALVGVVLNSLLVYYGGREFLLLGCCSLFEVLSLFPALDYRWYFAVLLGAWIETPLGFLVQFVVVFAITILYVQHNYIVAGYRERMREDVVTEQNLKKDIREREHASREEIRK